ncbi:hypothetical protein KAJ89_04065 [Candidatus Parcubacteria bacterium]|nr:hypothetical protein [Candidatus Parcubacteria bacterium]
MTFKEIIKTSIGMHVYSFAKTYITVAIGIYLTLNGIQGDIDPTILSEINLTDTAVIIASLKGGLLAVLRNGYKLLTE